MIKNWHQIKKKLIDTFRPKSITKILKFLVFLYLVLFPFGQLMRLPLGNLLPAEVHLYLTDILVGIITLVWFFLLFKKGSSTLSKSELLRPILAWVAISFASLLANFFRLGFKETLISGLYWWRWLMYTGLYLAVFDLKKSNREFKRNHFWRYLLAIGSFLAFFGLIQYCLWPDLRPLKVIDWDPHYYRVVGTFLDPGYTGLILVFTLLILVRHWEKIRPSLKWFLAFFIYLALALTYSRSSYLAFMVAMAVISWVIKKPKILMVSILVMLLTILFLPRPPGEGGQLGRYYSIEARIRSWQQAIAIGRDFPLLGVGFNSYRYAKRDYGYLIEDSWQTSHSGAGADSSLLLVFATTGLFGLTIYLGLMIKMMSSVRKKTWATILPILIHGFFLNSLFYPWVMAWWWLVLATESS